MQLQRTPLHYAAMECHKDAVGLLLERGASVGVEDQVRGQRTTVHT